ncbi:hypothetical protein AQUSIP_12650 [Aquicella siphonis]|uniref:Phage ABA sandwich domain-containing protein n=1 Tax=Aquicella siphonis TaxID=254247 RepID=A0A5E4PGG6_9COXI|nr:hypothetical protein [Aquicella siphonis]VVC75964.1 hypothetical protein AQUSIP_12650 [Aquicella siphonis]
MKLEEQVISLDLARKLHDLGVRSESLFRWHDPLNDNDWEPTALKKAYIEKHDYNPENYPAYTVAELGEMLPVCIQDYYWLEIHKIARNKYDGFIIKYVNDSFYSIFITANKKEADARCLTLVYLIENNYVKVEDLNDK